MHDLARRNALAVVFGVSGGPFRGVLTFHPLAVVARQRRAGRESGDQPGSVTDIRW